MSPRGGTAPGRPPPLYPPLAWMKMTAKIIENKVYRFSVFVIKTFFFIPLREAAKKFNGCAIKALPPSPRTLWPSEILQIKTKINNKKIFFP